MKKILVLYYTQTGQQKEILDQMLSPLIQNPEMRVDFHAIKPIPDYPFPWDSEQFFDAFPESFLEIPTEIAPFPSQVLSEDYDLIILGYQVWYLSPSIPFNSLLKSEQGKQLLAGKPVVTVIGCRNMWVNAQEKVKKSLKNIGAQLVGNIALVDRSVNHVSLVTIVHWMFTGKKDRYLGVFPKPGVSDQDIQQSKRFGQTLIPFILKGQYQGLQEALLAQGAVMIRSLLVFIDQRGSAIFAKWAAIIRKKGLPGDPKRRPWLKAFYVYLWIALWIIAPIVSAAYMVLHLPFLPLIQKKIRYYKSVPVQ